MRPWKRRLICFFPSPIPATKSKSSGLGEEGDLGRRGPEWVTGWASEKGPYSSAPWTWVLQIRRDWCPVSCLEPWKGSSQGALSITVAIEKALRSLRLRHSFQNKLSQVYPTRVLRAVPKKLSKLTELGLELLLSVGSRVYQYLPVDLI